MNHFRNRLPMYFIFGTFASLRRIVLLGSVAAQKKNVGWAVVAVLVWFSFDTLVLEHRITTADGMPELYVSLGTLWHRREARKRHKYSGTQVLRCPSTQVPKHSGTQVHRYSGTQVTLAYNSKYSKNKEGGKTYLGTFTHSGIPDIVFKRYIAWIIHCE